MSVCSPRLANQFSTLARARTAAEGYWVKVESAIVYSSILSTYRRIGKCTRELPEAQPKEASRVHSYPLFGLFAARKYRFPLFLTAFAA